MKSLYRILKNDSEAVQIADIDRIFPEFGLHTMKEDPPADEIQETDVLDEVYSQAKAIVSAARLEAEDIKAQAHKEGLKAGEEEGYKAGAQKAQEEYNIRFEAELDQLKGRIEAYVKDIEHVKEGLLEQYIDDLKSIALAIGEKIVQTSLKSSSHVVERMILSATGRLKKVAWAKIYIGKGREVLDVKGDTAFLQELARLSDNVKIIMMEEEESGTCIVELPGEVIDMSVGTQLENIKEILNNARL